ncbi:MAG TPA: response regulator [Noviherbaspirillum sp.]|jgi:CheY-like chemotaxis protein/HPt (histidine-containing phosphotransfer) domain-containing protein|uniref:response regulator n=1 Tax=Noviherbaspirillum sp. TaxID=1926288 RepID=UPI002F95D242
MTTQNHPPPAAPSSPPSPDAIRLLIADDNPVNRALAAGLVARLGLHCDEAADGEEAACMHLAQPYDLLLMDCDMPRLDGYAACRRIRKEEGTRRRTPIVALTAGGSDGDRDACEDAGMDGFLSKPLDLPSLEAMLARWLPLPLQAQVGETDAAPDELEAVCRTFGKHFAELAALYLADSPARLLLLKEAVAGGELALVARVAHAFSGSCASIGASGLSQQCRDLELDARTRAAGLDRRLRGIEIAYARVAARVRQLAQSCASDQS